MEKINKNNKNDKPKPFVKLAGGKRQLTDILLMNVSKTV